MADIIDEKQTYINKLNSIGGSKQFVDDFTVIFEEYFDCFFAFRSLKRCVSEVFEKIA